VKKRISLGDAELGATADVLELVVVELLVVVGGVEVELVELVTVTPGVVHELSVPRIGNWAFATGVHVGYAIVDNAHAAVVVSVVVVVPSV
jgi:hypothetical protein